MKRTSSRKISLDELSPSRGGISLSNREMVPSNTLEINQTDASARDDGEANSFFYGFDKSDVYSAGPGQKTSTPTIFIVQNQEPLEIQKEFIVYFPDFNLKKVLVKLERNNIYY